MTFIMLSPFFKDNKQLTLERFPLAQVNRSLQAWDAADEYIINYISDDNSEANVLNNDKLRVVIFNDAFGALTTFFCHSQISTTMLEKKAAVYCINDSYISSQGIAYNIERNQLSNDNITQLNCLDSFPNNIDLILYKIPKSKSLLVAQLIQIKKNAGKNTVFIAADRAKEIHSSTLKLFEKYLGTTTTSLAVKKARLVFCQLDLQQHHECPFPSVWSLPNKTVNRDFSIINHANVYSREKLDIGARYFIENLPSVKDNSKVIDLGCGNGVIGLTILAKQPTAQIQFFDESHMAITSTETNIKTNLPDLLPQCQFHLNDCLTGVESNSVDLILCNPLFISKQQQPIILLGKCLKTAIEY